MEENTAATAMDAVARARRMQAEVDAMGVGRRRSPFAVLAEAVGAETRVLADIQAERQAQRKKWGVQHHPDGTALGIVRVNLFHEYDLLLEDARAQNDAVPDVATWESILREEFCEAMLETKDRAALRKELVQVAAVAVAWIEDIDRG